MSLMNTVTKLAIGFAAAKGLEAVQKQGGIGAVVDKLGQSAGSQMAGTSGLSDILKQISGGAGGGGLADMLGGLTGAGGASGGQDLSGMLGGLMSGASGQGGLASIGTLLGGLATARGGTGASEFEEVINQDNPTDEPAPEAVADLMLRTMAQAARADGDLDAQEKAKLVDALRDGDAADIEAVQRALQEPVNPQGLAADTPRGLETQVYTMALNAISLDNQAEAQFLHTLCEGLGISAEVANRINAGLGVPQLYRS